MKTINISQSGKQWHNWRNTGFGSSDAAALMGSVGWKSRDSIIEDKISGYTQSYENEAMARGKMLEPQARRLYEEITGRKMRPMCFEHDKYPFLKASLDGWNEKDGIILEIKCPLKDWNHKKVLLTHKIPYYYIPQCMHQLLVCDRAVKVHFWSYTDSPEFKPEDQYYMVELNRNQEYLEELLEKEVKAMEEVRASGKG